MLAAYHLASQSLPDRSSKFSRKDFTLPQLFACLVLRQFFKTDYRGICHILADNPLLLRLKELEALERVTEKIGRIDVTAGSGEGLEVLTNRLVRLQPQG